MGRRPISRWTWIYLGFVLFSVSGSWATRLTGADAGVIAPIAGALTLIAGVIAVLASGEFKTRSPVFHLLQGERMRWAIATALLILGALVEAVGVSTGLPFGRYVYTGRWVLSISVPGVGYFPLLVPIAWVLMAGGSALAINRMFARASVPVQSLLAGLLAATLDVPMEPVMVNRLGYWRWIDQGPLPGGAPIANFVGWTFTAGIAAWILLSNARARSWDATAVLAGQAVLMLGLALT